MARTIRLQPWAAAALAARALAPACFLGCDADTRTVFTTAGDFTAPPASPIPTAPPGAPAAGPIAEARP